MRVCDKILEGQKPRQSQSLLWSTIKERQIDCKISYMPYYTKHLFIYSFSLIKFLHTQQIFSIMKNLASGYELWINLLPRTTGTDSPPLISPLHHLPCIQSFSQHGIVFRKNVLPNWRVKRGMLELLKRRQYPQTKEINQN